MLFVKGLNLPKELRAYVRSDAPTLIFPALPEATETEKALREEDPRQARNLVIAKRDLRPGLGLGYRRYFDRCVPPFSSF
jgi:hypothetical protein